MSLAAQQLARMRGMTALYHKQFFRDTKFFMVLVLALFAGGLIGDPRLYLAVAPVALLGAAQTAFDAYYLMFARHYAAALERHLNDQAGQEILVAHHIEESYQFPLNTMKVVTLRFGRGFTWFGMMTALYTVVGIAGYVVGIAASGDPLSGLGSSWQLGYYLTVGLATAITLAVGWWWFVAGEGERRLRETIASHFAH